MQQPSYPVQFSIGYPDRALDRVSTAFRIFAAIPILIVLGTCGVKKLNRDRSAGLSWLGSVGVRPQRTAGYLIDEDHPAVTIGTRAPSRSMGSRSLSGALLLVQAAIAGPSRA